MAKIRRCAALLFLLPLLTVPAACGDDGDERAALEQDELERELELALEGDTVLPTFEDTALAEASESEAPQPRAARETRAQTRTADDAAQQPRRENARDPAPRAERPPRRPADPRAEPRVANRHVPTGTTFAIRLNETVSTETSQPGDAFTATLDDPIVDADGTVLIPSGATVRGRVTAVDRSDRVGETAVIKLAFESVSFRGHSHPLRATVVEASPERRHATSRKQQAAKVAAGAATGAILGRVLGKDTESTLKGAAIGAAAGTAIAMGTSDVDAVLPAGSRMVIRLDEPVEVPVGA